MTIKLFGLTGGVASGKSTVGARFLAQGVPVIDADLLARAVVEPGSEGLAAVAAAFGAEVIDASGRLDRAALGRIVFADAEKRRALGAILHPLIAAATQRRARELEAAGEPLACYEAALLVENGLADAFRPLVVVASPREIQRARIMERDGLSAAEADARIDAQLPLAAKIAAADFVIDNAGDLATMLRRADEVLDRIRAESGSEAGRSSADGRGDG